MPEIKVGRPRKVILLTGGSTGVGLALSKKLINSNKYHLVTTARESSLSRFQDEGIFSNENIWVRPLDVTNKKQRDALVAEIEEVFGSVDILINNAGLSLAGVVEHVGEEERLRQIDINFRAPLSLIRRVLPQMRARKSGKIINVSSVGGMMAMPTMSVYCASKFALEGASEALWYEVKPWNISVTLVQPGFINSDGFLKTMQSGGQKKCLERPGTDYFYQYEEMSKFISAIMKWTPTSPDHVAERILKAINTKKPPLRLAGSWDAYLFGIFRRLVPRQIYHWIVWRCLPSKMRFQAPSYFHNTAKNRISKRSLVS